MMLKRDLSNEIVDTDDDDDDRIEQADDNGREREMIQ